MPCLFYCTAPLGLDWPSVPCQNESGHPTSPHLHQDTLEYHMRDSVDIYQYRLGYKVLVPTMTQGNSDRHPQWRKSVHEQASCKWQTDVIMVAA